MGICPMATCLTGLPLHLILMRCIFWRFLSGAFNMHNKSLLLLLTSVMAAYGQLPLCASFDHRRPHDRCADASIRGRLLLYMLNAAAQNGKNGWCLACAHCCQNAGHANMRRRSYLFLSSAVAEPLPFARDSLSSFHSCLSVWCRCPLS